eukprot:9781136-Lingulodinium_polyedra.AAC.1
MPPRVVCCHRGRRGGASRAYRAFDGSGLWDCSHWHAPCPQCGSYGWDCMFGGLNWNHDLR